MNIDIHCTHISPMMTLANCCSPHLAVSLGGDHGDSTVQYSTVQYSTVQYSTPGLAVSLGGDHGDSIIVIVSWTPSSLGGDTDD